MPTPADRRRTARSAALWATVLATAVSALAAAVVAWRAGLGQEQARIVEAVVVPACCGVGALVLSGRPGQPVGRALLVGGAAWGLASLPVELLVDRLATGTDALAAGLLAVAFTVRGLGWMLLAVLLPLLFPDGASGVWRWWLRLAAADLGLFAAMMLAQPTLVDDRLAAIDNPIGLPRSLTAVWEATALVVAALGAACLVAGLVAVARRWRHGDALVRQQVGWFALGLVVAVAGVVLLFSGVPAAPVFSLAVAALPIAVGVAVLQHRLYELDVLVNRALLWTVLTAAVVAVYVLVVAGVGAMLDERGAGWLPWAATAVVAVAFQPLREVIQGAVNRLTFGAWDDPQALVRSLHTRLEQATRPERALPDVLAATVQSLHLDHLSVTTAEGQPLASAGGPPGDAPRRLPLVHAGTPVGELVVGGGRRRRRDEDVLAELAAALAPAVQAARLHADLQHSRERLVVAREEERRRLRRDLHDGLGPALAGLTLKLDTARNLLGDEPLLREMRADVQAAIADVRRLVEGLRPVPLDELGLPEALRRLVDRTPAGGPAVSLVTDGADSPAAAVELAAYRIVQEALTNVLRHSGAGSCDVSVRGENGHLVVRVADDGRGLPDDAGVGSGAETMRERAEELGGSLDLLPRPGGGTVVRAVRPRNPS
ncbi:sensor histidine kinase [Blastococcus sp. PRF04-17]|uniref:sensor histidine kinase n=1 Tax=Blastococcus sp. PRF04-17 TaxID=2933797 RepID=UPI001FF204C5|nr:sensor histidine kinase [Blastococcus sp. PRF04-17]UOY01932.1 sensor histidine kinase [Blastococcus sp. PRF04-17]